MEYKPFDLEAAKRGEKVVMIHRFFDPAPIAVIEVCQFPSGNIGAMLGNGTLYSFDGNGFAFNYQLVMAPKPKRKVKGWVNIYPQHKGLLTGYRIGTVYESQAEADENALKNRIALAPIEFEVGEYEFFKD